MIAFFLNNWNQDRSNRSLERRFLNDITVDVEEDIQNLHVLTIETARSVESKNRIFKHIEERNLSDDSVIYYLGDLSQFNKFIPKTLTIEELKNTYGLVVIRNVELRRKIVSL